MITREAVARRQLREEGAAMRGERFEQATRRGALGLLAVLAAGLAGVHRAAAKGCMADADCVPCSVCVNDACIPLDPICGPNAPQGSPGCDVCHVCDGCGHCVATPTAHACIPNGCASDADCGTCQACIGGGCVAIDPMCPPNGPIGAPPCGRCEQCSACGMCVPAFHCRHRRRHHRHANGR
jgi:hypothetical protein